LPEPKILVLDIETLPNLGWHWGAWQQNIYINQVVIPTRMTSFGASWLGEKKIMHFSEWDWSNPRPMLEIIDGLPAVAEWVREPHRDMVVAMWELLSEADGVVHFNGKKFDIPHVYREFMEHGLGPPAPFSQADVMVAAKKAKFYSNKLEWISRQIGLDGKADDGGFDTWLQIMQGNPVAMRRFTRYCKRDVGLTKEALFEVRPYMSGLPNYNLFLEDGEAEGCDKCGSKNIKPRGHAYTKVSVFDQYRCDDCGGWSRKGRRDRGADLRGVAL
jgi:hypothetical protein